MNVDNQLWTERREPGAIKKVNTLFAKKAAYICPGFSNTNLTCAVMNAKPISLTHLRMSKEQVRDYWLNRSVSTNADWVRAQWNNIQLLLKHRHLRFDGKRHFLAVATGQVST